jgi:ubiquinone/menaquinone biosynthesis C-methylase UbiE
MLWLAREDCAVEQIAHYVRDYRHLAAWLLANRPTRDEAMEEVVGGSYAEIGAIERAILRDLGLATGHVVVDVGCGTGRLSSALGAEFGDRIEFLGTDVVPEFLDYARTKSPPSYRFELHTDLSVPVPDGSADFISAFSVFTHLFHAESFIYLEGMKRALRPGGRIVFSFLECARHWLIFENCLQERRANRQGVLVTFIELPMIEQWAKVLELNIEGYLFGPPLGQSVAILSVR